YHPFHAEASREFDVLSVGRERPRNYLLGAPAFSNNFDAFQIGFHSTLSLTTGLTSASWLENANPLNCCLTSSAKRITSPTTTSRGGTRRGALESSRTLVM